MSQLDCNLKIKTRAGQTVGIVRQGCFYRSFRTQHVLRKPPALAIEIYVLDQLKRAGVEVLNFTNQETGVIYRVTLAHFLAASFLIDRGCGPQKALPLNGWIVTRRGAALQLPLWEAAK